MSALRDHTSSLLLEIREQNGGRLTPPIVLDAAKAEDHPLHSHFEWDDTVAGHRYRLAQAQQLLVRAKVTYSDDDSGEKVTLRAFIAVSVDSQTYVYEPTEEIPLNPVTEELALRQMEREWRTLLNKYNRYEAFFEMVKLDLSDEQG